MKIRQPCALHESCRRLRQLHPQCPRTYGVAVLADVNKRRWSPLDSILTLDRLRLHFDATAAVTDRRTAGNVLAARLIHEVLGRMLPLLLLEGRAWDTGLENLWVHFDGEDDIDWVAVVDPTVRGLPDDPAISGRDGLGDRSGLGIHGERAHGDTILALPNEAALTTWVAHRCHRTLTPLFVWLHTVCGGTLSIASMWQLVGSTVVMTDSQLPRLPHRDEDVTLRRSQAVLDAMVRFGLPVRGPAVPVRHTKIWQSQPAVRGVGVSAVARASVRSGVAL
ncbi:iron reductase [Mycolicibacter minnesotensis]